MKTNCDLVRNFKSLYDVASLGRKMLKNSWEKRDGNLTSAALWQRRSGGLGVSING